MIDWSLCRKYTYNVDFSVVMSSIDQMQLNEKHGDLRWIYSPSKTGFHFIYQWPFHKIILYFEWDKLIAVRLWVYCSEMMKYTRLQMHSCGNWLIFFKLWNTKKIEWINFREYSWNLKFHECICHMFLELGQNMQLISMSMQMYFISVQYLKSCISALAQRCIRLL